MDEEINLNELIFSLKRLLQNFNSQELKKQYVAFFEMNERNNLFLKSSLFNNIGKSSIDKFNYLNFSKSTLKFDNNDSLTRERRDTDTFNVLLEFQNLLDRLPRLNDRFEQLIENYKYVNKREEDYQNIHMDLLNHIGTEENVVTKLFNNALETLFSLEYYKHSVSSLRYYFYNILFTNISLHFENLISFLGELFLRDVFSFEREVFNGKTIKDVFHEKELSGKPITQFLKKEYEFDFLSYSFNDKFLTFLLFVEARKEKKVLYIDWMYQNKIDDIKTLKKSLCHYLCLSKKFLFLETLNSNFEEINDNTRMQKMVRQWCAWEQGIYYKRHALRYHNHRMKMIKFEDFISNNNHGANRTNVQDNNFISDLKVIKELKHL